MMPSTSTLIAGEDSVVPPLASVSGESSLSDMTQTVHFSSGNPRIGETRGVMHLFPDDAVSPSSSSSSSSILPVRFLQIRPSFVWLHRFISDLNLEWCYCRLDWEEPSCLRSWCAEPYDVRRFLPVLRLLHPAHTRNANCEVRRSLSSFSKLWTTVFGSEKLVSLLAFHLYRNDGMENRYNILIRFDSQESADTYYQHFRGKRFNSLEVWFCFERRPKADLKLHLFFVIDLLLPIFFAGRGVSFAFYSRCSVYWL